MLIDFETGKEITKMPYLKNFELLLKRLSAAELKEARQALNAKIDGDEIHTAGWMPGADWTGTPFQPIYSKAAGKDQKTAAKLFGLLVWDVFSNREERWFTGRFELHGKDIGSRTYFRAT